MKLMSRIQLFSVTVALFAFLLSGGCLAHVKWFVDTAAVTAPPLEPYSLFDAEVIVWIGIALALVLLAIFLESKLPLTRRGGAVTQKNVTEILRICVGMSLLLSAYEGSLIAPHYAAYGMLGAILLVLQAAIGIMLIANRGVFHASILILILFFGVIAQIGVVETLEYWNVIGIALFLLLTHAPAKSDVEKYQSYAVPLLRIFTGFALMILGFSEKLLGAQYGEAFIAAYDWNFMQKMGATLFTDRLFVLSAGMVEVVFGIILILGAITRLNTIAISFCMITSNITFVLQDNNPAAMLELIGHLPVIATALILITMGSGSRLSVGRFFVNSRRLRLPLPFVVKPVGHEAKPQAGGAINPQGA